MVKALGDYSRNYRRANLGRAPVAVENATFRPDVACLPLFFPSNFCLKVGCNRDTFVVRMRFMLVMYFLTVPAMPRYVLQPCKRGYLQVRCEQAENGKQV